MKNAPRFEVFVFFDGRYHRINCKPVTRREASLMLSVADCVLAFRRVIPTCSQQEEQKKSKDLDQISFQHALLVPSPRVKSGLLRLILGLGFSGHAVFFLVAFAQSATVVTGKILALQTNTFCQKSFRVLRQFSWRGSKQSLKPTGDCSQLFNRFANRVFCLHVLNCSGIVRTIKTLALVLCKFHAKCYAKNFAQNTKQSIAQEFAGR